MVTYTDVQFNNHSWELALKPGYYTIIVQYTTINIRPGNNCLPCTTDSRPGRHPLSAHFRLARSPHPRRSQGFGNLPESRPGFREIPCTTTMSSPWSYGVFVPKYPARAGVPLRIWGFASTIRTLPDSGPQITLSPIKIPSTISCTMNHTPHI